MDMSPIIERFRHAHHTVAMMFAMGMSVQEISKRTGFTPRRLRILLNDPTFRELIDHYANEHIQQLRQALPEKLEMMEFLHTATLRHLVDLFEEADETGEAIPPNIVLKVHDAMADRIGFSKHTMKTVVSVSFAAELDRAIERSGKGPELKVIEGGIGPLADVPSSPLRTQVTRSLPLPERVFRRA